MGSLFIDTEKVRSYSTDSLTRFLTSVIIRVSGVNELNRITSSLKSDFSDPSFVSELFGLNKISVKVSDFNIPQNGPFIVLFPVISGLVEFFSSIAAIVESSHRKDIKLFVSDPGFSKMDAMESYFLPFHLGSVSSQLHSAVKHLNNGGGIIYFQRFSFNSNQIGFEDLHIPVKLSKLTGSALIPMMVDFDIFLFNSLSYFFGDWCYLLFSVRRFLSFKGISLSMSFSEPLDPNLSLDDAVKYLTRLYRLSIHKDNIESLVTLPFALFTQIKNAFVPRGTKV